MLAPFLLFFVLFVVYPVLMTLLGSLSYQNLNTPSGWAGLAHFRYILTMDRHFRMALQNTVVFAAISTAVLTLLGLVVAVLLSQAGRPGRWLQALLVFPYTLSTVSVAMVWLAMLDRQSGMVNKALQLLGGARVGWLEEPSLALYSLVFVHIWKYLGYCMLIYLAGIQALPRELYEAATMDGAGERGKLLHVTLPALRPVIYFVLITTAVESFKTFDLVRVMTDGNPLSNRTTTIVHQIYLRGFVNDYRRMDEASAMSVILLLIVLAIALAGFRMNRPVE